MISLNRSFLWVHSTTQAEEGRRWPGRDPGPQAPIPSHTVPGLPVVSFGTFILGCKSWLLKDLSPPQAAQ